MTLKAYLAGSDTAYNIRLGAVGLTTKGDGDVGFGNIQFDDPDKSIVTRSFMDVLVVEDDCIAAPVLYHGCMGTRRISRQSGDITYKDGVSRGIDADILDGNEYLAFRLLINPDAKRPAEGDDDRIAWLLSNADPGGLDGLIADLGGINTAPNPFEDADYRGQYAKDVLSDMADPLGKVAFVYFTQPDGDYGLFYDWPTSTLSTSPLSISNDMADTSSTCFYPLLDASQELDGSEVVSLIRYLYLNGLVLEGDATTFNAFFSAAATGGLNLGNRGIQVESTRVGAETTARSHAQAILAKDSEERDTITVSILVPSTQAGLIEPQQRISVKFTHLDGHDTFGYMRVVTRTIQQWITTGWYLITLELTNAAARGNGGGGGGGGTGGVPLPPSGPPTIVQKKFGIIPSVGPLAGTLTLDNPPSAGNWLVMGVAARGSSITLTSGWTDHPHGSITPGSDFGKMAYRVVGSGESADVPITTTAGHYAQIWEVSGIDGTLDASSFADVDTGTQPASINAGTITPTAGQPAILFAFLVMHCSDWGGNGPTSMSTPTGWTTDGEYEVTNNGDLHPNVQADSRVETATSGGYGTSSTVAGAGFNFGGWGGLALAFLGSATANPPQPGQWVDWTIVTMTTSGGVSVGTTLYPYQDRSLQIKVDGVLISPASYTETDPATGAFALSWLLDSSEVVQVRYQGRA